MYQIPLASVCKHLLTWGAVQALEVTSVLQVPTCTVPGQQIAKAVKLSWQFKEAIQQQSWKSGNHSFQRESGYLGGLTLSKWYWDLSARRDHTWHCKLDVISNWWLFCERKRTEKSLSWEETTSLWAVTQRWDAHKAGWSGVSEYIPSAGLRERPAPARHPAAGGGRIWAPQDWSAYRPHGQGSPWFIQVFSR